MKETMKSPWPQPRSRRQQLGDSVAFRLRGQATVDYLVLCTVLALMLGIGLVDSNSVLWQLIAAFQTAYQKFSFSLSLPQ